MAQEFLSPQIIQNLETVAYLLPTILLVKKVHTLSYKVDKGVFKPYEGEIIGRISPDGHIENTDYKFNEDSFNGGGKTVNGGVAITKHSELEKLNDQYLYNPATGDLFKKTKSGKGFFNLVKRIFVKGWLEEE